MQLSPERRMSGIYSKSEILVVVAPEKNFRLKQTATRSGDAPRIAVCYAPARITVGSL